MAKKLVYTTNTAGATTDYAAADGTWKTIPGGGGGSGTSFSFGLIGNTTVGAGVTTYVSIIGYPYSATEFLRMIPTPQNCSFSRFYFYIISNQPATGSLVITLRKNQVDTALAITIAAGSVSGRYSNTATSVAFSANDWNSVKIQNNATSASAITASLSIMITI